MKATDLFHNAFAVPSTAEITAARTDDDLNPVPRASEAGESFSSGWEAAWIDLGGEG